MTVSLPDSSRCMLAYQYSRTHAQLIHGPALYANPAAKLAMRHPMHRSLPKCNTIFLVHNLLTLQTS